MWNFSQTILIVDVESQKRKKSKRSVFEEGRRRISRSSSSLSSDRTCNHSAASIIWCLARSADHHEIHEKRFAIKRETPLSFFRRRRRRLQRRTSSRAPRRETPQEHVCARVFADACHARTSPRRREAERATRRPDKKRARVFSVVWERTRVSLDVILFRRRPSSRSYH